MTEAGIAAEKSKAYSDLRKKIEWVFAPERVENFLKSLKRREIKIRDFKSAVLMHLEAETQFTQMSSWEKGEIRELYLNSLEKVDGKLREKYAQLYQYY